MPVRRLSGWLLAFGLLCCGSAASAQAVSHCGRPPCNTTQTVKGISVKPGDDNFQLRGDIFNDNFVDEDVTRGSVLVTLPFSINLAPGLTQVTQLYVNRNGTVSVGAPIAGYRPVQNLADLGVPVIAPFYSNLATGAGSGDDSLGLGDVVVQTGRADPVADGGEFRESDAISAVRITWYGLTDLGGPAGGDNSVYAQLLISADQNGLTSFEFRYGPPGVPRQAGFESIAGFALGDTQVQFQGPYGADIPTYFEFADGRYIGQFGTPIATASVPEPATWTAMILGFVLAGGTLRHRRRQAGATSLVPAAA